MHYVDVFSYIFCETWVPPHLRLIKMFIFPVTQTMSWLLNVYKHWRIKTRHPRRLPKALVSTLKALPCKQDLWISCQHLLSCKYSQIRTCCILVLKVKTPEPKQFHPQHQVLTGILLAVPNYCVATTLDRTHYWGPKIHAKIQYDKN